jgi:hypothetical protein
MAAQVEQRYDWTNMSTWRSRLTWCLLVALLLLDTACRAGAGGIGGGRGAAARSLPMPTEPAQWLALAVFIFGAWWAVMKLIGR